GTPPGSSRPPGRTDAKPAARGRGKVGKVSGVVVSARRSGKRGEARGPRGESTSPSAGGPGRPGPEGRLGVSDQRGRPGMVSGSAGAGRGLGRGARSRRPRGPLVGGNRRGQGERQVPQRSPGVAQAPKRRCGTTAIL